MSPILLPLDLLFSVVVFCLSFSCKYLSIADGVLICTSPGRARLQGLFSHCSTSISISLLFFFLLWRLSHSNMYPDTAFFGIDCLHSWDGWTIGSTGIDALSGRAY